jgi:hypothetical protein
MQCAGMNKHEGSLRLSCSNELKMGIFSQEFYGLPGVASINQPHSFVRNHLQQNCSTTNLSVIFDIGKLLFIRFRLDPYPRPIEATLSTNDRGKPWSSQSRLHVGLSNWLFPGEADFVPHRPLRMHPAKKDARRRGEGGTQTTSIYIVQHSE